MSARLLRDGGGAGGGPLLDATVLPVFSGLRGFIRGGGTEGGGGGGGGALLRRSKLVSSPLPSALSSGVALAFFCSMYCLMKSEFSSIWSSVIPISNNSPRSPRHEGSTLSRDDPLSRFVLEPCELGGSPEGIIDCG